MANFSGRQQYDPAILVGIIIRKLAVAGLVAGALWLSGKVALVHTDVGMAGTTSLMRVERWHLEWRFDYHIIQGSTDFKRDTDGQPL